MKRVARPGPWLPLYLLIATAGDSAAQAPQPPKPRDQSEVKLPAFLSAKPLPEEPTDDELRKLLKARYNESLAELKGYYGFEDLVRRGGPDIAYRSDDLYGVWRRFVRAGLELCAKPEERVALLTRYVETAREAEKVAQARHKAGRMAHTDLHRARYERLDAEIQLLRAKREADKAKAR